MPKKLFQKKTGKAPRPPGRKANINKNGANRPLFKLDCHTYGIVNFLANGAVQMQINIAPTVLNFTEATKNVANFQYYRIPKVTYQVMPLVNTSLAKDLVVMVAVPAFGGTFPAANMTAYTDYSAAKFYLLDKTRKFSFVPFAATSKESQATSTLLRAPKIPAGMTLQPHFGHSLLFNRYDNTGTQKIRLVISITIQFYGYDGGQALLKKSIPNKEIYQSLKALCSRSDHDQLQQKLEKSVEEQSDGQQAQLLEKLEKLRISKTLKNSFQKLG